jgi:dihydrolipoamide dehydrogenase
MAEKKRLTIIGGGVAGYPAAIRAARLGAEVTLIEREAIGGTCLNWGCIPTKALLQSAETMERIRESEVFGVRVSGFELDFQAVMKRKAAVVERLTKGVRSLLAAKKIRVVNGTAEFVDSRTVRVLETDEKITSERILIATGSKPAYPSIEGLESSGAWNSNDVLGMESAPTRVVIIGGGFIGVEFAQVLKAFGSDVTILEIMPQIVPGVDREIAVTLQRLLARSGIKVMTSARVGKISAGGAQKSVLYTCEDQSEELVTDRIILTTGRKPDFSHLGVDRIGLDAAKGAIAVNDRLETSVPGICAAGDVIGGIMLAHVAMAEGDLAARNMMGADLRMDYGTVPGCVYTRPEIASVGLTEEKAKAANDIEIGRFFFRANGKAVIMNEIDGMVKIVSDRKSGHVLGVHILGPHATDLISEAVLGMRLGMTVKDLAEAIHPHPSLSEAIMEAAQATGLSE